MFFLLQQFHQMRRLITFHSELVIAPLYLTNQLGFQPSLANGIVALFLALNFALHLLSGYIGNRLLSYRALLLLSFLFEIDIISSICSILSLEVDFHNNIGFNWYCPFVNFTIILYTLLGLVMIMIYNSGHKDLNGNPLTKLMQNLTSNVGLVKYIE